MRSLGPADRGRRSAIAAGFLVLFICTGANYSFGVLFKPIIQDLGWNRATLAGAGSAGLFVYAFAQLLAGQRWGVRAALTATYLLRGAAFGWLLFAHQSWQLYLFALLFGATFFTTAPLTATLIGQTFGLERQGRVFGVANMLHHLSSALGSYAGGLVFDRTQSYSTIFAGSLLLVLMAAIVQWASATRKTSPLPRQSVSACSE